MCVNYKSHIIQDYFGDGSAFGANIEYVFENQRMGTAGALSLLHVKPTSFTCNVVFNIMYSFVWIQTQGFLFLHLEV